MGDINFKMPSLGADMDFGKIVKWYIAPGDKVKRGDIVADIETSKSDIEIESFDTGIVKSLLIEEGVKVKVGTPIAIFSVEGRESEEIPEKATKKAIKKEGPIEQERAQKKIINKDVLVSPRAKRLMAEKNLNQRDIQNIIKDGMITGQDIERATNSKESQVLDDRVVQRQKVIAQLMKKSKETIPHFYIEKEMEVDNLMAWLEQANEMRSIEERFIPAVIFIKVLASCLIKYPQFNGVYLNGDKGFIASEAINIGIVISLREGGLIAPALQNVDKKSLTQLMQEFRDLVTRAREGKLKQAEMNSSTICLTNLGDRGGDRVYGVIYPPQVAIIGIGRIFNKVIKKDDQFIEIPICHWSMSVDHRVSDGHQGSLFLNQVQKFLNNPKSWEDYE